ncbi:sensor histidine kinase [Clostridium kluyveri]|uniref:histidine kinase n=1 Tax=Clostridium kluyveri TaxID=1534 RepID=A0A1L5F6V2_CLOKL|nr:HAMP domain-containing sensor histidine kinase [Clostridium kluyveri]APM38729.1 two-component sensor histidine kinase [Clostridium kluyveri]UZQ51046.1 HAMP domain-containing histidine kinase [Clostridium kluyveri]
MKKPKIKSLMLRIWMTFTIMILIIICCISLLYMFVFRAFDEKAKIEDLKVAHNMLLKNDNFNEPLRFDKLRNLREIQNLVVTIDNNETKIMDINQPPNQPRPEQSDERNWMISFTKYAESGQKQFKEYYNNRKFFFIISSIKNQQSGKSYLITYMPYFADNSILYNVIIIGIIFIIIAFFTSKLVASYISRPLKELENYTRRISNKQWGEPIKVKSNDEIGSLADSMNVMQKKLKYADENEKLFLQSISHDLKTPVMVIMGHAEAIIDGIYIDSVEKTAEIIRDEALNLEKRIKEILYFNTLEYMLENNVENESVDLGQIVNNMIDRFNVLKNDIHWELDIHKSLIWGDMEKIQVSIENILDNALRYAKTTINISLKDENGFSTLEIYNDGNSIKNEDMKHIFDNMYKDKTGNFGMGLAISKKIIDFYGGDIKAVNREKGVSFIIKYPIKSNH